MPHRINEQAWVLYMCAHTPLIPHPQLLLWLIMFFWKKYKGFTWMQIQVKQEFPTKYILPRGKKISWFPIFLTEKGGSICSLACPLMSEPGLPSAPVCSKFTRRSSVSQGWEAMCRSWARTKGLGVATLLSGTSQAVRPPHKGRAKRVSGSTALGWPQTSPQLPSPFIRLLAAKLHQWAKQMSF